MLMLLFIQLLAGFFLRQYRSSMEEYRYYEALLRHREGLLASYLLRKQTGEASQLMAFAAELAQVAAPLKVGSGETTLILEAQKSEANEFAELMRATFDALRRGKQTDSDKSDGS